MSIEIKLGRERLAEAQAAYAELVGRGVLPSREALKVLTAYHEKHPFDVIGEHRVAARRAALQKDSNVD